MMSDVLTALRIYIYFYDYPPSKW